MLKRFFLWKTEKTPVEKISEKSLFLKAFIGIAEEVLLWKNNYLAVIFLVLMNLAFFVSIYVDMKFLHFIASVLLYIMCMDALEAWLKHKHRTSCLKKMPHSDGMQIYQIIVKICLWIKHKVDEYLSLREANPAKSFLLSNIILGMLFIIGRCISGALLFYILAMAITLAKPAAPHIRKLLRKIPQHADSDEELEGLLPEISEKNIMDLSFDAMPGTVEQSRFSTEQWLPEDVGDGNLSDSSDNSNSLLDKTCTLDKDFESSSSDSSEEYLPKSVEEKMLKSMNVEEIKPPDTVTWGGSAMNTLWNIGGALTSTINYKARPKDKKYKPIPSDDSTDGFEIIDEKDVL